MIKKNTIAFSVIENAYKNDGSTVRPLRILEILKEYYNLVLITKSESERPLDNLDNLDIISVNPKSIWNLKLLEIVFKYNFNIVYCSNDFFGFFSYYLLSKILRYKIIYETHSIISKEVNEMGNGYIKIKISQILEKFVIKNANYVIALSENSYEFYKRYNQNIELIPVFVDENIFKKIHRVPDNIPVEKRIIGLIGPFDSFFNEYHLQFLYKNLNEFDKRINFKIIGKCDYIIKNNRIRYTGYLDSVDDYVYELSELDAVMIPSNKATFGPLNKIIESMSCSLPVFTTPKGAVGLYNIKNQEDILIFNEDEIIQNINELIFDSELMTNIGIKSRKTIENYYSKTVNKEKILKILDKI